MVRVVVLSLFFVWCVLVHVMCGVESTVIAIIVLFGVWQFVLCLEL